MGIPKVLATRELEQRKTDTAYNGDRAYTLNMLATDGDEDRASSIAANQHIADSKAETAKLRKN